VRALGVEVRGLTADEGRLDTLYRELVGEAESHPGHDAAGRSLPHGQAPAKAGS
jgi:hypothetical protein